MARALRDQGLTPADELRELLDECERSIAVIRGSAARVTTLLENMDRLARLWPELADSGADLRAEAGRWDTLQATLRRRAAEIVQASRPLGGLSRLRSAREITGLDRWWWFLDSELRARRRRRAILGGGVALGIFLAGALVAGLLYKLVPQDPRANATRSLKLHGQSQAQEKQDYAGALSDFRQAVALGPDDLEGWLWLSALQAKTGDMATAAEADRRARALATSQLDFYLSRAPVFLSLQMPDEAGRDLEWASQIDPTNPLVFYYLAAVYESRGQYPQAVTALEQAGEQAQARQQPQISAMARYRMAVLMQQSHQAQQGWQGIGPPVAR